MMKMSNRSDAERWMTKITKIIVVRSGNATSPECWMQ